MGNSKFAIWTLNRKHFEILSLVTTRSRQIEALIFNIGACSNILRDGKHTMSLLSRIERWIHYFLTEHSIRPRETCVLRRGVASL